MRLENSMDLRSSKKGVTITVKDVEQSSLRLWVHHLLTSLTKTIYSSNSEEVDLHWPLLQRDRLPYLGLWHCCCFIVSCQIIREARLLSNHCVEKMLLVTSLSHLSPTHLIQMTASHLYPKLLPLSLSDFPVLDFARKPTPPVFCLSCNLEVSQDLWPKEPKDSGRRFLETFLSRFVIFVHSQFSRNNFAFYYKWSFNWNWLQKISF